jgi:hypothetical protein
MAMAAYQWRNRHQKIWQIMYLSVALSTAWHQRSLKKQANIGENQATAASMASGIE